MKSLEEKIVKEGKIFEGDILKVDCFLNHKIDVEFLAEVGKEFYRLFGDGKITKILTIEASGIGVACVAALQFDPVVPVLFAKKSKSSNIGNDFYHSTVQSYTHGKAYDVIVSKSYLGADDRVLILDDFLAKGSAMEALIDLCGQAGATIVGAGSVIEKVYQGGGDFIRSKGVRVESLARIKSMDTENGIIFE